MTQVVDWLTSQEILRSLEQIFADNPDSNYSDALASTIDRLIAFQQLLRAN